MKILRDEADLTNATGVMRATVYRPDSADVFAGLIFYSEIFQLTEPVHRLAATLAGHGFVVVAPEIFHELNPMGTVLGYDDPGKDKGNEDKATKTLEAHDLDTQRLVDFLRQHPNCSGRLGAMGICIGGHLAFRAARNEAIDAASCFYATDLHSNTLACAPGNGSLERASEIHGELQMVFGKQDPHIPKEGRAQIYRVLTEANVNFTWHEFNAEHAFLRDEGPRFDPELALIGLSLAIGMLKRTLNAVLG